MSYGLKYKAIQPAIWVLISLSLKAQNFKSEV